MKIRLAKSKFLERYLLFLALFFVGAEKSVWAYIDPGSGGYLITSLLATIGGVFAFASAFVIHFFRNVIGRSLVFLWRNHRLKSMLALALATAAGAFFAGQFFYEPQVPEFDSKLSGARIIDLPRISPGYNFYEGTLIDLNGRVVKKWSSLSLGVIDVNGDYYAQKYFEAPIWGRYTWDDQIVWEKNFPIHHEILLTPQETIITFTKEVHEYNRRKVEFDVILELDKNGKELSRFSLWEHLKEFQKYHRKLELDMPPSFLIPESHRKEKSIWGGEYDYYHLNALSLVPPNQKVGVHPAFAPGNWIISFRHGSMIFILDKETKKILWRAIDRQVPDRLEGPHSPTMLGNGNILLFDNGRYRKWSRILELDPVTLKPAWEFRERDFYTLSQGHVQKLLNGNMLATEAEKGYVFEVTPDKKIVWEYYHPDQQNAQNSTDKEKWGLRQEIYRMTRYAPEVIEPLLQK